MLFHEYSFLFIFLPLVLLVYSLAPGQARNGVLLVFSLLFYAVGSFFYLPILIASTVLDYFLGGAIADAKSPQSKKIFLGLSIGCNLSLLGYFKYAGFLSESALRLFPGASIPHFEIILPIGISFYTFQSMSYSIDVYRGLASRSRSLIDFATYVSMFPQLIAGPIVRYREIEAQLSKRAVDRDKQFEGVDLFITGLAKKLLLADTASTIADPIFSAVDPSMEAAWLGILAYSAQIYFDFSGYTDMARGLGKILGFEFPLNFNSPYKASSFREFWRRWHITLSRWLRDNLYIPLGGSRKGRLTTFVALATTMLLGGLWHGASWNFVIWGGLHGSYLVVERIFENRSNPRLPKFLRHCLVCFGVLIAWVFFRVETFSDAIKWLSTMFGQSDGLFDVSLWQWAVVVVLFGIIFGCPNSDNIDRSPSIRRSIVLLTLLISSVLLGYGRGISPFLYFRF